ncbi:MAG: ATP-binding cassette domain-containing protein [Methanosarcinaceae archaeon]|nr:ATP-binding cassette domain-containing protein [Methanosarcinaceae archaeon]
MLNVSNIVKDYEVNSEKIRILNDISFSVKNGEILGITGKSGSGKSTLLKILRGVEPFEEGSFELDGETFTPESGSLGAKTLNKNTAIHLQRTFGLWTGPAIENIIRKLNFLREGHESLPLPDSPHYDEMYEKSMVYLKLVGMEHKALHAANLLSGGEKQRIIIARQLAASPKLLLLDEPVTMTGPDTKQEVLDAIKDLKNTLNIPIIVVSHLPEIHMYLADRVIFLQDGKIFDEGKPKDVLKHFLNELKPQVELAPVTETEPIIQVRDLSKRLALIRVGEVLNIKDFSLDIYRGEIVALIGPSGAGKTTILKMMEGLSKIKSGFVGYLHEGEWIDITQYSKKRIELRSKISIMHQEFTMSPHSTVKQQIAFRLSIKMAGAIEYARQKAIELKISDETLDMIYQLPDMSEDEKTQALQDMKMSIDIFPKLFPHVPDTDVIKYAKKVFDAMDLPMSVLDKTPYQISGGEHVRAFIALALATSPEILMLDEPFGDLDPVTLRDVTNSLKNINAKFGTTIVLVSHHMDFVKEVAHRAVLIDNGAIVDDGKAHEVCDLLIERSHATYLEHNIQELAN